MRNETVLLTAEFDPRLKTYWVLRDALIWLSTVFGVVMLPFWFLGLGKFVATRRYDHLHAELTDRALHLRKGVWFKVDKTIPLDKIQDVALHHGPIMDKLGLCTLRIETAGGSAQGMADATFTGVVDAVGFRDAVLTQRDRVTATAGDGGTDADVFVEIRDALHRIEGLLARSA